MKADAVSSRASSAKRPKRLRYLDLSFEGHDLLFKNDDMDNGRLPHGGYKGSKKHPMGIFSWDKGREYQRQIQDDLQRLMDSEVVEAHGSPHWTLEAHRQPTHSGESPLLLNKFLSPSKHELVNGSERWVRTSRPGRNSAPPCPQGLRYYRPNRMHQYLTATELKNASDSDDVLRYGRPTRTTLLRARQRANHPAESYSLRRQLEQRMEELKNTSVFSNPKEFAQHQSEVEGETFHSFLTGARYNRAHCLDSKSMTQYGVYMPRDNPLGCFVIGHRADIVDNTSAPPGSRLPLSYNREGPARFESRLPRVQGTSLSRRNKVREAADDTSEANQPPPSLAEPSVARPERHLPELPPEAEGDSKPQQAEPEAESKPETPAVLASSSQPVTVPSLSSHEPAPIPEDTGEAEGEEGEEKEEREKEGATEKTAPEEEGETTEKEGVTEDKEGATEHTEEDGKEEEEKEGQNGAGGEREEAKATGEKSMGGGEDTEAATVQNTEDGETKTQPGVTDDVATAESDVTGADVTGKMEAEEGGAAVSQNVEGQAGAGQADDVAFFLTEEGVVTDQTTADVEDAKKTVVEGEPEGAEAGEKVAAEDGRAVDTSATAAGSDAKQLQQGEATQSDADVNNGSANRQLRNEDSEAEDLDQGEGQGEPLKVIVTHIERSMGAPVSKETGDEVELK